MLKRKVTYRMYPNASQEKRLHEVLLIHQRVYNEALEARIKAYRDENRTLTFQAQCKMLTLWRKNPHLSDINAQSLQVTLKRLDLAFQAFYRRVKLGQKPGFPRFKPTHKFRLGAQTRFRSGTGRVGESQRVCDVEPRNFHYTVRLVGVVHF